MEKEKTMSSWVVKAAGMSGALAMIVNEAFVKQYVAGGHALGKRVQINGSDSGKVYSIVGVVAVGGVLIYEVGIEGLLSGKRKKKAA